MENRIITAVFKESKNTKVSDVWQWDYGQILRIQGLNLPTAVEVDFAVAGASESIARIGTTKDGVTDVVIPDSLIETGNNLVAYIYLRDSESGNTEYQIDMLVTKRAKPEAYDTPEDKELFGQAIEAVNTAADRAEKAGQTAQEAATKAGQDAEQTAQDRAEVAKMVEAVNQSVQNAKTELENTIRASEESKEALTGAITESGTAITKVNESIKNAGTAVEETVATTSETKKATEAAQSAESKLSQSTADAEELKTALDQAVGGVAQDATAEEILKILQKSADYMAQIAESAGKAGSLNGFGLNLLEDGSVSLTYSDPDTGELQDSAIFPKETTLTALDKALGEMNESLKIIALREGGAL